MVIPSTRSAARHRVPDRQSGHGWQSRAADGVELAGDRYGPDHGPVPVLLAHGFGQTRHAWMRTAERLADAGYPALAFDARGHGGSGRNPATLPYSTEQFVSDQVVLAGSFGRAVSAAEPVLVGASMGGLIGLVAQHRHALYSALVLVDIAPRWRPEGVARILDFMAAHPDGFDDYRHAADAIAERLPHRPRKTQEQLASLLVNDRSGRLRWHWDVRLLDDIGRAGDRDQAALLAAAGALTVPVLLVSGGRSELIDTDHIDEFLALAPHAEHIRLPEATHMVAGDDNDRFTDAVLDFLGRRPRLRSPLPTSTPGESP